MLCFKQNKKFEKTNKKNSQSFLFAGISIAHKIHIFPVIQHQLTAGDQRVSNDRITVEINIPRDDGIGVRNQQSHLILSVPLLDNARPVRAGEEKQYFRPLG